MYEVKEPLEELAKKIVDTLVLRGFIRIGEREAAIHFVLKDLEG